MSKERKGVSPSDAGQPARSAANKLRNIAKAKARREADAKKCQALFRGSTRSARRDAARPAWLNQEIDPKGRSKPLSAFDTPTV